MLSLLLALSLVAGGYLTWRLLRIGHRPADLPPGPPTVPLLGNLHQMPRENAHLQFTRWAKEYGPIYSLMLGTKTMIVLTSDEVVKDLIDKRGHIYSSRPDSYIGKLSTGDLSFIHMAYNSQYKQAQKILHQTLNKNTARVYFPYQDLESKQMLHDLLEQPEYFKEHLRRAANSLITQVVLGFRVTDPLADPNLLELWDNFLKWVKVIGSVTTALLDVYPVLQYLPSFMLPSKRAAQACHARDLRFWRRHWDAIKAEIRQGTAVPCIAQDILKAQDASGGGGGAITDDYAAYICGLILLAGSETTTTQLHAFIQAMILHPDVQAQAQAEVDRVCGDARLPGRDDWDELPYIRACVKEVLRWFPAAPFGVPHCVTRADEYRGYRIPKDATIMMNIWGINNSPRRARNPRAFDPSRYLGDPRTAREAARAPAATQRDHFSFGGGRRLCYGLDLAETAVFVGIARLAWAFTLSAGTAPSGDREIWPDPDAVVVDAAMRPADYPATIAARSETRARMVRGEWARARESCLREGDGQWREVPAEMAGMAAKGYAPGAEEGVGYDGAKEKV
ncbi:cytochrome P450 [Xylariomycetidae sp. FL0641]|nr:cytochrome P450 [Xylariomycetidae sp. FL0641]